MTNFAIKIKDLTKIYNLYNSPLDRFKEALHPFKKRYHEEFHALHDVSLDIVQGESIGIIGMNGSGKSTLLKVISGIITPSGGSVEVNGRISALLELGAGFNPEFSGIENAEFQCSMQGYSRPQTQELLREIIEFADIGEFIHQPVKTYSSGMYVRLAFAVAISVDPDILIVDEALAVGDAYFQIKCMNKIKSFMKKNKTLIFVSHDPGAIKTLCSRAFLLQQGRLLDSGSPETVFNYYNSLIAEKQERGHFQQLKDKSELSKRSGNGRARISHVAILNESKIPIETVVSGEVVTIKIEIELFDTVIDPTVGILIRDRLGNDIFGINNALMGIKFGELTAGQKLEVRYSLKMDLGPNLYSLTVATHAEETHVDESYDWVNNLVAFRVVESSDYRFVGCNRLMPHLNWSI